MDNTTTLAVVWSKLLDLHEDNPELRVYLDAALDAVKQAMEICGLIVDDGECDSCECWSDDDCGRCGCTIEDGECECDPIYSTCNCSDCKCVRLQEAQKPIDFG